MTQLVLPRPDATEAAPWYHGYIAAVPDEQIGIRLVRQVGELEGIVQSLDDQAALARYAEGKWSIKEVIGHITDAERIFAYRLLRVSRGDSTPLPGFDENAYVVAAHFDERPLRDLLTEFREVRRSTLALAEGIRPDCWALRGQANNQPISARALAYIIFGHAAHHIMVLQTRYGLDATARTTPPAATASRNGEIVGSRSTHAPIDDRPIELQRGPLTVSTDRTRLNLDAVHALLQTTFWGHATARDTLARAMANSLCFGLYDTGRLVGFGRVVTDRATYAYWTDVVTAPEYRGQGLGQWLCQCMLDHPDLQGLRRIGLVTRDAARLYGRLGFTTDTGTLTYMERRAATEPVG